MHDVIDSFTFEHDGKTYLAEIVPDYDHGAPWDEEDGHGPVTGWESRDKLPGELVLSEDRRARRFYDFAEACKIARREGWGWLPEPVRVERHVGYRLPTYRSGGFSIASDDAQTAYSDLYRQCRESMSPREYAARAARADYERLRGWCNDEWCWVGVVVRLEDDENPDEPFASLWGIESDAESYLKEVAQELAEELATAYEDA